MLLFVGWAKWTIMIHCRACKYGVSCSPVGSYDEANAAHQNAASTQ
jgi:hypothetical protein